MAHIGHGVIRVHSCGPYRTWCDQSSYDIGHGVIRVHSCGSYRTWCDQGSFM